jgi:transitional endoplasmic reticulum ATPase
MAHAVLSRAARVAGLVDDADAGATVQRVVDGVLRVVAGPKRAGLAASPIVYDVAFANASIDIAALATALSRSHGRVRACLYGPPGAGKTAFVRHAAERADKKLIVKRMSDLLSCWVGATEQLIARMFEQARDEDAVLLLDEADGLLRSREGAQQSWEVTQTNELLTQMEAFEGAFFCATNLVDALDHAAFRRFDVKVRFDPLTRAQRRALFGRAFAREIDDVTGHRIDRLDGLCAGHFSAVSRRLALLDGHDAIAALEEEHRFVRSGARVGFVA